MAAKRAPQRGPKTILLGFWTTPEMLGQIDAAAAEESLTRSALVRSLVAKGIKRINAATICERAQDEAVVLGK